MKLLALLAFCLASVVAIAAEHPKEYYDPEVQKLIKVQQFVFGPVGFDRQPSNGERAFGALVKRAESVRYFLQVFDNGSPEACCYAMVALREFSPELFADAVTKFRANAPTTITVADGENASEVATEKIVDSINRGFYRKYFLQYESER